jgi:hypothetical protein
MSTLTLFISSLKGFPVLSFVFSLSLPFLLLWKGFCSLLSYCLEVSTCLTVLSFFLNAFTSSTSRFDLDCLSLASSSSSLLKISARDLMILGKVYNLLAIDNLNRSSISRLNYLISSSFCLSIWLWDIEGSTTGLCLLLRSESSYEEYR